MRKSPMIFSSLKVPVFNSNCTLSQSLAFTCFSCGMSEQNMRFFCVKRNFNSNFDFMKYQKLNYLIMKDLQLFICVKEYR